MRVCALVLLASMALAQQPPRDALPHPRAERGTSVIRGHVVALDTGLPLRHAMVVLSPLPPTTLETGRGSGGTAPPLNATVAQSRQSVTDSEGAFEFTGLAAGNYRLYANPGQYGPQYVGVGYGSQRPQDDPGRTIALAAGEVFDKATIALPRGGVIAGRVTDEAGQPLPRVQVYPIWYARGSTRGMRNNAGSATDDLGQFRIFGLPSGDYVVAAELRGGTFVPPNSRVERPEEVRGFITTYYPGTADPGAAQRVRVALNRETPGIELRMVEGRLYRVSGSVMDSQGRPAARVNGTLMQRSPDGTTSFGSGFSTDEQGRFQMQNIAPATYRLGIRPRGSFGPQDAPLQDAEWALVPVAVVDADIEGLVIVLTRGTTISGQVVFEQGAPAAAGPPLRVNVVPGEQDFIGMTPPPAVVQPDLTFTMKGLMGEVLLRVAAPNMVLKEVRVGSEEVTDTPHEFKEKDRVTIVLTSRASSVEGTVTDAKGSPVDETFGVVMLPEDRRGWRYSSTRFHRAGTDAKGHFLIRNVTAGRYYIVAGPRGRLFVPGPGDPSVFEPLVKEATTIYVGDDEQRTVDLKSITIDGDQ